jgi:hypothetical protein
MKPHGWGANAGLTLETKRKLKSAEVSFIPLDTGDTDPSSDASLSMATIYADALYRWDNLYLPFGFNISFPGLMSPPYALRSPKPGLGIQVGLGYFVSSAVSLYSELRVLTFMVDTYRDVAGNEITMNSGALAGITFGVRGYFF